MCRVSPRPQAAVKQPAIPANRIRLPPMTFRKAYAFLICLVAGVAGSRTRSSPFGARRSTGRGDGRTILALSEVSAGGYHSCGVATDQRVYCWGLNGDGQLGVDDTLTIDPAGGWSRAGSVHSTSSASDAPHLRRGDRQPGLLLGRRRSTDDWATARAAIG